MTSLLHMRALLPLALLFALAAGGCDGIIEPDRAIVIDGVVVEAGTNRPLPGISVRLDRDAFSGPVRPVLAGSVTDADGRYLVERGTNIEGSYRIFVTDPRLFDLDGPGYYDTDGVNDFPVQPGDDRTIRIEMIWVER